MHQYSNYISLLLINTFCIIWSSLLLHWSSQFVLFYFFLTYFTFDGWCQCHISFQSYYLLLMNTLLPINTFFFCKYFFLSSCTRNMAHNAVNTRSQSLLHRKYTCTRPVRQMPFGVTTLKIEDTVHIGKYCNCTTLPLHLHKSLDSKFIIAFH